MSREIPSYCYACQCGRYPVNDRCRLVSWVIDGWSSQKGKNKQLKRLDELGSQGPEGLKELKRLCIEYGL